MLVLVRSLVRCFGNVVTDTFDYFDVVVRQALIYLINAFEIIKLACFNIVHQVLTIHHLQAYKVALGHICDPTVVDGDSDGAFFKFTTF